MSIVMLLRATSGGPVWPEGVTQSAVERCLAVVEARDPLTLPADRAAVAGAPVAAFAMSEEAPGEVLGLAWRLPTPDGWQVDLRVQPGQRRRGLGSALLRAVSEGAGPVLAGCDAAHPRVRRFLLHHGFELAGVVFHQRWDGEPRDVPPAFGSARLEAPAEAATAVSLLRDASKATWPRPTVTAEEAAHGHRRIAWRGDQPAGVLLAHRERDAWEVDGLAVLPGHRGLGVGRMLLAELMRLAAADALGVSLRVSQSDEDTLAWTQKLGFWTFRTWALYRREKG